MFKKKLKLSPIMSFIILIFVIILLSGFLHLLNTQGEYTTVNKVTSELINNVVENASYPCCFAYFAVCSSLTL